MIVFPEKKKIALLKEGIAEIEKDKDPRIVRYLLFHQQPSFCCCFLIPKENGSKEIVNLVA